MRPACQDKVASLRKPEPVDIPPKTLSQRSESPGTRKKEEQQSVTSIDRSRRDRTGSHRHTAHTKR